MSTEHTGHLSYQGRLAKGSSLVHEGESWRVESVDQSLDGGEVICTAGSRTLRLDLQSAMNASLWTHQMRHGVCTSVPQADLYDGLTRKQRTQLHFKVAVVSFVLGIATARDVEGILDPGPDGTFDLALWRDAGSDASIEHLRACLQRRAKSTAEAPGGRLAPGMYVPARATIYNWRAIVVGDQDPSDPGLDPQWHLLRPRPRGRPQSRNVADLFVESVNRQITAMASGSTKSAKSIRLLAEAECKEAGVDPGSARACREYVAERRRERFGTAETAKQRRSRALKPENGYAGNNAVEAMQVVELDGHTMDVVTSDGKNQARYTLVAAVDSYSGFVLAVRVEKRAADGSVVARVIYDVLANRPLLDAATFDRVFAPLPDEFRVNIEQSIGHGPPNAVTTDRGTEFLNELVLRVCSLAGISVMPCAPYQPAQKATIEAIFRAVTAAAELLDGHVGRSPDHRGLVLNLSSGPVPPSTVEATVRSALSIHNFTPNRPVVGGLESSPYDRFSQSLARRGDISFLGQPQVLYRFLPRYEPTLTTSGLRINNCRYVTEQLYDWGWDVGSKVVVHLDNRDISRAFVPHGDIADGRWLAVANLSVPEGEGWSAELVREMQRRVRNRPTNALKTALEELRVGSVQHPFTELARTIDADRVRQAALDRQMSQVQSVDPARPVEPPPKSIEVPRTPNGDIVLADAF